MIKILPDDIPNTLDVLQDFGLTISTQSKKIICLYLIPDDFRLLSGDEQGKVQIWDKFTYSLILSFKAHLSRVYRITSISSQNIIITCSEDSSIGIWNFQSYSLIKNIQTKQIPYCIKMVPNLQYIAVGCKWGYLAIYRLNTFELIFTEKYCGREIWQMELDKSNTTLILGSFDKFIISFDLNHFFQARNYRSSSSVTCVCISNQYNLVVIGEMNGGISFLSLSEFGLIRSIENAHQDSIRDLIVSADEEQAISASSDCSISIWNLKEMEKVFNIRQHLGYVNCIVSDWNKDILYSSSWDGTIKGIAIGSGCVDNEVNVHIGKMRSLFIDNKNNLVYTNDVFGCLRVWDLTKRKFLWKFHQELGFLCDKIACLKKILVVSNNMKCVYVFKIR